MIAPNDTGLANFTLCKVNSNNKDLPVFVLDENKTTCSPTPLKSGDINATFHIAGKIGKEI